MDVPVNLINELLKLGFPGIVITGLSFIAYKFYKRIEELQNLRLSDMKEMTSVIKEISESVDKMSDILSNLKSVIDSLPRGRK